MRVSDDTVLGYWFAEILSGIESIVIGKPEEFFWFIP